MPSLHCTYFQISTAQMRITRMNELVIVMSLSMVEKFGTYRFVQNRNAITVNCAMNLHKKCN